MAKYKGWGRPRGKSSRKRDTEVCLKGWIGDSSVKEWGHLSSGWSFVYNEGMEERVDRVLQVGAGVDISMLGRMSKRH